MKDWYWAVTCASGSSKCFISGSSNIGEKPFWGYIALIPMGSKMATVDGHGTAGSSWIVFVGACRSVVGGTAVAAGPTVRMRGHGIWHPAGRHLEVTNLGMGTVPEGGGGR